MNLTVARLSTRGFILLSVDLLEVESLSNKPGNKAVRKKLNERYRAVIPDLIETQEAAQNCGIPCIE